jgi:hypothetical protein
MAAWKCGDPDYRSEEDHPRCDPRTRSGRLRHKIPDPEAVETAITEDCTLRFKMQLKIERDRQDDVRLLTNVFANLAPYRRASALTLDSPSWSRGQLLDLVQYMGKLDEGLQLSTIISHLQLNLPSDQFTAILDAMQSSLNSAYSDMWQSLIPCDTSHRSVQQCRGAIHRSDLSKCLHSVLTRLGVHGAWQVCHHGIFSRARALLQNYAVPRDCSPVCTSRTRCRMSSRHVSRSHWQLQ